MRKPTRTRAGTRSDRLQEDRSLVGSAANDGSQSVPAAGPIDTTGRTGPRFAGQPRRTSVRCPSPSAGH